MAANDTVPQNVYAAIGELLEQHALDPSPAHYEILHRYVTGTDRRLVDAVNAAIERFGRLTEEQALRISREDAVAAVDADELSRMTEKARAALEAVTGTVVGSADDAGRYATDLQGLGADAGLREIMELTVGMIERTRQAEERLRVSSTEISEMRDTLAEAQRRAAHDPLTGLPNRRSLDTRLKDMSANARKNGTPMSVAIVDIDHFKRVNDTHGHPIGDQVIKIVGKLLTEVQGDAPFVGRYGGEEFVILFDGLTAADAREKLDQVRERLAGTTIRGTKSSIDIGRITFSGGVCDMPTRRTGTEMLKNADKALYRAKETGRNRICIAGDRE